MTNGAAFDVNSGVKWPKMGWYSFLPVVLIACIFLTSGCASTSGSADLVEPIPPTPITSMAEFETSVLQADLPVIVAFHSPKCSYCRELLRYIPTLGGRHAGQAKFMTVCTLKNKDIKKRYRIKGVPVVIFFRDGKEHKRLEGGRPLAEWKRVVAKFLR